MSQIFANIFNEILCRPIRQNRRYFQKYRLTLSNSNNFTILLNAKDKRRLQELFRKIGYTRLFVDYVFSAMLYLLIKNSKNLNKTINVDIEYSGHTKIISDLVNIFNNKNKVNIHWQLVGKSSNVHDVAYKVYKQKCKPNQKILGQDIWKLVTKKAGGCLNSGLSPKNRHSAPAI